MNFIVRTGLQIFLSVLIVASFISLSATYAFSHISEGLEDAAVDVAFEGIQNQAATEAGGKLDWNEIYADLESECVGKSSIRVEQLNKTFSCSEIRAAGVNGIEMFFSAEIKKQIKQSSQYRQVADEFFSKLKIIPFVITILGVIALALVLFLFFISVSLQGFFIHLGILSLVSGLPYFLTSRIKTAATLLVPPYPSFQGLVSQYLSVISAIFIGLISIGIILIVIGCVFIFVKRRNITKEKK